MKTFKRFITEAQVTDQFKMVDLIVRDCQPYLRALKNSPHMFPLYRGMKNEDPFVEKRVRKDRRPLTTKRHIQNSIDDFFEGEFGIRYRSESIFVTGSLSDANGYGNPYVVFPIGEFDFLWSKEVNDLYYAIPADVKYVKGELGPMLVDMLEEALVVARYQDTDLIAAVESRNEVMIAADSYYAVKYGHYDPVVRNGVKDILKARLTS